MQQGASTSNATSDAPTGVAGGNTSMLFVYRALMPVSVMWLRSVSLAHLSRGSLAGSACVLPPGGGPELCQCAAGYPTPMQSSQHAHQEKKERNQLQ